MATEKIYIYRAGVIPYVIENDKIVMMFMKPSDPTYGGNQFQVSKGHVEPGESSVEAAIREGEEELGLFKGNILNIVDLGVFLGRSTFFIARIADADMFGDTDKETAAVKWMTLEEFEKDGRQLHVPVVKAAVRKIMAIEQLK